MAKKGRHRQGGRVTPKGTRPAGFRTSDREPDLMLDARRALREKHPLGLLALVSGLVSVVDPRRRDPFERTPSAQLTRAELVHTFLDTDRPETSALLAVMSALGADEVEQRRIAHELAQRADLLPAWLHGIGAADAHWTAETTDLLGDGENVLVAVRFPTGDELTAVVYVDHNLGTVVKDAFVVPERAAVVRARMQATAADQDVTLAEIAPADAKTRIVEAIASGAITYPPFETESWPMCRPLVEWMVSLLPDGGRGYERHEWTEAERDDLAERFLRSPFAAAVQSDDHRELLDSILWYGSDYGTGDPLRFSPVSVEILLADWIPRKIVAPAAFLSKAPEVLRAFVRFGHAERDIPSRLTDETLDAIDVWEPEYQQIIRSPRPQGPEALLAAIGAVDPEGPWPDPPDYATSMREIGVEMLAGLERAVGGRAALDALEDFPLPDEPFDFTGITDGARSRVDDVLALCDGWCDDVGDVEYRTATRRLLGRIARVGPDALLRGRPDTAAAAICWSVGTANDLFTPRRTGVLVKDLLAHFGLTGSVAARAGTLLTAAGIPQSPYDYALGSPAFLVAETRRDIIDHRDRYEAWIAGDVDGS